LLVLAAGVAVHTHAARRTQAQSLSTPVRLLRSEKDAEGPFNWDLFAATTNQGLLTTAAFLEWGESVAVLYYLWLQSR